MSRCRGRGQSRRASPSRRKRSADHLIENLVPLAVTIPDGDGPGRAEADTAERALLYVAATRAKKEITVLSFGTPSPFLD